MLGRVHNLKRTSYNAGLRANRHNLRQPKQFSNLKIIETIFMLTLLLLVLFLRAIFCFVHYFHDSLSFKVTGNSFQHFPTVLL